MDRFQTSSERGFSLIELMAVMALLSILAITAAPSFDSGQEAALAASAETLAADIRLTRLGAVVSGSSRSITFTAGSGVYVYDSGAGSGKTRDLSEIRRGITISSDAVISFNSLGECGMAETTVRLTLNGVSRTVIVAPYTGKTSIQ